MSSATSEISKIRKIYKRSTNIRISRRIIAQNLFFFATSHRLFVDSGTGSNVPRGSSLTKNSGDIGRENERKRSSRIAFVVKQRKNRWLSRKKLCLGKEHTGILSRLLRSGILPSHFQRTQHRHYAPCSHYRISLFMLRMYDTISPLFFLTWKVVDPFKPRPLRCSSQDISFTGLPLIDRISSPISNPAC